MKYGRNLVAFVVAVAAVLSSFADYSRLDFITCNGKNWINTGYTPTSTDRIEMKVRFVDFSQNQCLFCSRASGALNRVGAFFNLSGNGKIRYDRGNGGTVTADKEFTSAADSSVDHLIIWDGNEKKGYIDSTAYNFTDSAGTYAGGSEMALFVSHNGTMPASDMTYYAKCRFYYCRIYNKDGKLMRNFVPAQDNSQAAGAAAQCGVWDTVTETFFPNQGAAAFTTTDATVKGTFAKRISPVREVSIVENEASGSSGTLKLNFSNPGFAQRLYLAWSANATGGDTTNTWETVETLEGVTAVETTRVVTVPNTAKYVRFFLQPIPSAGGTVVEYVHSTGANEYVNTGFTPSSTSRVDCHFAFDATRAQYYMAPFGSRVDGKLQYFAAANTTDNFWYRRYNTQNIGDKTSYANKPGWAGEHRISFDHNQCTIDTYTHQMSRDEFTCAYPAYLFAFNNKGEAGYFANIKLYSCALWDDGLLVRDYVPCKDASGTPALYDTVAGTFTYGSGTTALTAGADVWRGSAVVDLTSAVKATWTGAGDGVSSTDNGNWNCVNVAGQSVAGGLTEGVTELYIAGDNVRLSSAERIPHGSVAFGPLTTLGADCDWRGLGTLNLTGKIDVAGHTLRVADLSGSGGKITDTQEFDLTTTDTSKVSSSSTFYNTSVAANLFNNNFARDGANNAKRVIIKKANLPMVVDYNFGASTTIDAYRVWYGPSNDMKRGPKTWTLEGSNNGSDWTVVDSRDNVYWQTDNCGMIFSLATPATYQRFRFKVTDCRASDSDYMEFVQLEYGRESGFGTVQIDVPAGTTIQNNDVTLDGQLKVVKEGEGTLVMAKENQSFWSLTVKAGTVKGTPSDKKFQLGRSGCQLTVEAGATLDLAGAYGVSTYTFNLNGGTLANSSSVASPHGKALVQNVHLGADSIVDFNGYGFTPGSGVNVFLDLNGSTLTCKQSGTLCYLNSVIANAGTLKLVGQWEIYSGTTFTAPNTRIVNEGQMDINGTATFGEYVENTSATEMRYNAALTVTKLFMPNTDYYRGCTLADGVTIDLSDRTNTLSTTSLLSTTTQTALVFTENATYTVDLGTRRAKNGEKLIGWTTKPANIDTVKFNLSRRIGRLTVKDDGLYFGRGMVIVFH